VGKVNAVGALEPDNWHAEAIPKMKNTKNRYRPRKLFITTSMMLIIDIHETQNTSGEFPKGVRKTQFHGFLISGIYINVSGGLESTTPGLISEQSYVTGAHATMETSE
jgi:hypothetical protein